MADDTNANNDSRDELLGLLHEEFNHATTQTKELKSLVDQTNKEVERLQQKNALVTNRLHQIETNFDSVPRQDIKVAFTEAMDTRSRLLTMRGNLEKLQSDYKQYSGTVELLSNIISHIEGYSPASFQSDSAEDVVDISPAGLTIIRIIEAQETERKRLARQMHDGPAQSLTNLILQAEICQRLFDRNPDRAGEELNNLKTAASSTFQKIRDFIFDLRPMMLDDLGLIPTIRRYIEATSEKSGLTINLHILGDERRLESHREVIMFRGIQEVLSNTRAHAKADQMTITLDMGPEVITCSLEDNGIGFNSELIFEESVQPAGDQGVGLKTLKERLELIGGALIVDSAEGDGAKLIIRIPAGNPPQLI